MRRWNVIVVDDEAEIAEYVGGLVEELLGEEAQVEVFHSGTRARKRMEEGPVDLLLTDIVMPVTDGFALLSYVAEHQKDAEVILLTAYEEFDYIYRANKIRPCGYIVKAEREEVILKGIRNAIETLRMREENQKTVSHARAQIKEVEQIFSEERAKQMLSYGEEIAEEREIIRRVKEYIRENCGEDLTAASVAARFHYSPAYLSKLFGMYSGEKLSVYIMNEKLKAAKHLLLETDLTVHAIAARLGYLSPQAFARAFRRELGMTPQEYRRNRSQGLW
mgnify:CR=1 FL=1